MGGEYFLQQIWVAGQARGRELPRSKAEMRLAQNHGKPESVIVAANNEPFLSSGAHHRHGIRAARVLRRRRDSVLRSRDRGCHGLHSIAHSDDCVEVGREEAFDSLSSVAGSDEDGTMHVRQL